MKTACIALKQFLFAGAVLAVGQLFNTTKIHAGELQVRGLARLATAEELQENQGIDDQLGEEDQLIEEGPDSAPNDIDNEKQELDDEQPADDAGSDAGSSEEASAPVPKRRGRK